MLTKYVSRMADSCQFVKGYLQLQQNIL